MNQVPDPSDSNRQSVRAAGDRTIEQYESWMQTNGAAHLMRVARQTGIMSQLRERQHTLGELCEALSLDPKTAELVVDGLVAIGFVERYRDDLALARAGQLLCQYDEDLGDDAWNRLGERLQGRSDSVSADHAAYRWRLAATQWIHTAAAMQAAEILDIGGEDAASGIRILDLGSGSAVWSCAMAHRDPQATIVAVDEASALGAAKSTAASIGLDDRLQTIESDPVLASVGENGFDLVVLAQLLSGYSDEQAAGLLEKAAAAAKPGGRVVAPDFYVGPGKAGLKESLGRLSIHLSTPEGRVRELRQCQQMFLAVGLEHIQFTYLSASEAGLGMIVAEA